MRTLILKVRIFLTIALCYECSRCAGARSPESQPMICPLHGLAFAPEVIQRTMTSTQ